MEGKNGLCRNEFEVKKIGAKDGVDEDFVFCRMQEIRQEILPHSSEVMKKSRMEVFRAIKQLLCVAEVARVYGLDPLCKEGRRLAESDSHLDRFLALELNEDSLAWASLSDMLKEYDSFQGSVSDRFIMYIYMRGIDMIHHGISAYAMTAICKSMLPVEARRQFCAYLKLIRLK